MVNVGFIGCGNMGSAIMKGILSSKMSSDVKIFAFDKSEAALDKAMSMGVTGVSEAKDVVGHQSGPKIHHRIDDEFQCVTSPFSAHTLLCQTTNAYR